jgi:hypothetical protein
MILFNNCPAAPRMARLVDLHQPGRLPQKANSRLGISPHAEHGSCSMADQFRTFLAFSNFRGDHLQLAGAVVGW